MTLLFIFISEVRKLRLKREKGSNFKKIICSVVWITTQIIHFSIPGAFRACHASILLVKHLRLHVRYQVQGCGERLVRLEKPKRKTVYLMKITKSKQDGGFQVLWWSWLCLGMGSSGQRMGREWHCGSPSGTCKWHNMNNSSLMNMKI